MYSASNPDASRTRRAASQHSIPIPSPGSHAIRFLGMSRFRILLLQERDQTARFKQLDRTRIEFRCGILLTPSLVYDPAGRHVDFQLVTLLQAGNRIGGDDKGQPEV